MNDVLLLVGRVLIALVFLLTVWLGSPNAGYVGSLGLSSPVAWSVLARTIEWLIVISLVLGIATRYGALLGILYVIIATALAHRFWQSPDAQWVAQYTNFSKNLAILGGLILIYVNGTGAFGLDRVWTARRAST
jgi:putative oxidoreductase